MTERTVRNLPKWPFFLGDILLLILAAVIVAFSHQPLGWWEVAACVAAVGGGAGLAVWPFLLEYRAVLKLCEADKLADTVAQIHNLEQVSAQLTGATARWQSVQESADKTAAHARQIVDLIAHEAKSFQEFLKKNNDTERAHLRLEVEKANRAQTEWLQLTVHLLDHIFALHQAGSRSGQPSVASQLTQFQNACRDLVRRVGLVPFEPQPGEDFNGNMHQVPEAQAAPAKGARVATIAAPGFTFQGQPLRKALVLVEDSKSAKPSSELRAEEPDQKQPPLL